MGPSRTNPAKYYTIIPDALGRGGSLKPSEGLKGNFPHYRYHDMIDVTHRLVTDGLKVAHLQLVIGSSLGCMQQNVAGVSHVECDPGSTEISGFSWEEESMYAAIRHSKGW